MQTVWLDLKEVLLELVNGADGELQPTQGFAENIQNAVEVGAGDKRQDVNVYIPLCEKTFNFVRFGYKYVRHQTDCRSRITTVALHKIAGPGQLSLVYSEAVCLNSEVYNFYTFPQISYPDPCAAVNGKTSPCAPNEQFDNDKPVDAGLPTFYSETGWLLAITIQYVDPRDKVVIGPVGMENHLPTKTEVSPLDFGAVGDGIVDDTEPLQRSIAYAQANKLPIHLQHRTYAFSETLEIAGPIHVTNKGMTITDGTLHYTNELGSAVHIGKAKGIVPVVTMENVSIVGKSEIGLDLSRSNHSSFHKVSVTGGFKVGLILRGSLFNTFRECSFIENEVNVQITGYPFVNQDGEDKWSRSNDNSFWHCILIKSSGAASLYIGELTETIDLSAANNAFYSCDFEEFQQRAVVIDGGHQTSFIQCRFENTFSDKKMVHLKDAGEGTRFVSCKFVPDNSDIALEVEKLHKSVKVIGTRIKLPPDIEKFENIEFALVF